MIPYGRQSISEEDVSAVVEVLRSDWLTQGPTIERFEHAVAEYCGAKYAVAVSSATAALHIACVAAGLEPGDRLWTSPNTFIASANCGRYCGAPVGFVDINPRTYNLDAMVLAESLAQSEKDGTLPKLIIPVHFAGQSCDMRAIAELAKRYGVGVIEDASHAIGGSYLGQKIGSCAFSDMAVFSFHPVKIITTGEGGMVLTNRHDLYEKLMRLRSHGMTRDPQRMTKHPDGPWYYEQIELGFNYRLTDIQAALGISQLKRIDNFIERRHGLAREYDKALEGLPLVTPWRSSDAYSAFHLYVIRLNLDRLAKTRRQVVDELRHLGIGVNVHYIPVHTQPYYQQLGFGWGDFPEAEQYYREAMSLPLYPDLRDQDKVITAIHRVLS